MQGGMTLPHLLPSMLSRFYKTGKVDYSALMRTYSLGVEVLSNIRTWHRSRTWNPVSFHNCLLTIIIYIYSYWSSLIIYFYFHLSQRQLGSDHTSMDRTHPETISETFGNEATSEGKWWKLWYYRVQLWWPSEESWCVVEAEQTISTFGETEV